MASVATTPEFKLANVLVGHSDKDVRCICPLADGAFATGGRDQTMCIWEPKGNLYVEKYQSFHTSWVNAVCELPPLPSASNAALRQVGGIVAGLQDGTLAVHDRQAKLLYQLPGHTSQVSSLAVTSDGLVVSGSWDGTMRVWDLTTETCVHTQSEFENAVTVLALPNGDVATGSAGVQTGPSAVGQMKIRVFSPNGDGHYTLKHTVEDHQHKITELTNHGIGFASTSNDGTTRLRTLDGQVVQTIVNPTGEWGISLTSLQGTGELAVAHDDGVLQLWAGDVLQQMLVHPRGIWSVKQLSNGDLVTGCPQGKITIWSRDDARQADEASINQYNSATFSTRSMNAAKMGKQLDVNTLPNVEDKGQHVGVNDGDVRQFNKKGEAYTYRWDIASRSWVEMGKSTGSSKQEVDGTYFDRVLPVEIDLPGSGLTTCKLGFNDGDNPYIVAQKFCAKHKIDAMQVQQIVDFINQNRAVTGTTLGNQAGNYGSDMTMGQLGEGGVLDMAQLMNGGGGGGGGQGAYNGGDPGASSSYGSKETPRGERWPSPDFPQRLPLPFDSNRNALNGMTKVLTETSMEIYDEKQQLVLNDLLDVICETSRYHASKVTDQAVQLLVDTLTSTNGISCPLDKLFPFMDLLRGCCLHLDFLSRLCSLYRLDDVLSSLMAQAFDVDSVKSAHTFLFLQAVCNLLVSSTSRDATLDFIAANQDTVLGSSTLTQHKHKHVLNGYATLLLNVASHVFNETQFGAKSAIMFSQHVTDRCVELITHATNKATAAGGNTKKSSPMLVVAKRAFVACGTVRVRASVNTDTAAVDAGSEVIIQLDANWIAFHAMAVKCIQQHERK
jgi:phospholipase A-2-activating protein